MWICSGFFSYDLTHRDVGDFELISTFLSARSFYSRASSLYLTGYGPGELRQRLSR